MPIRSSILIVSALIGSPGGWLHEVMATATVQAPVDYSLDSIAEAFVLSSQATNAAWARWEIELTTFSLMRPLHKRSGLGPVAGYPCCRLQRIMMAVWFGSRSRGLRTPAPARATWRQGVVELTR